MTKRMISALAGGIVAAALIVGPALADKLEKVDGKNITVGGKSYEVSASRTKVTIAGKEGNRDALKAGMDCKIEGGGQTPTELKSIDCK